MVLSKVKVGSKACIKSVSGSDKIKAFLFSLGCYDGEEITLISILSDNYVINLKDGRYAIDRKMASSIELIEQ